MRPIYVTRTADGESAPIPLDINKNPFNVSLALLVTGTVTATVQWTNDDIQARGYSAASGNWFDLTDIDGVTANDFAHLTMPVRAIRLKTESMSGATATLQIVQAG